MLGLGDRIGVLARDRRTRTQFVRYLATGFASAAVEFSVFAVLNGTAAWSIFCANYASIAMALTVNFLLSRYWTFGDRTVAPSEAARSFLWYVGLLLLNGLATGLLVGAFVRAGLGVLIAKFATMAMVAAWNFLLYRSVVFGTR